MTGTLVARAAMLALCLGAATAASAQDYRFAGFEGASGANATLNLRVPLGAGARRAPPTFGLTFGFGRPVGGQAVDDRPAIRQLRLADLRLDGSGLRRLQVAGFDLADPESGARWNLEGDGRRHHTLRLILIGLVGVAVGVGVEELLDNGDEADAADTPDYTPPPVG